MFDFNTIDPEQARSYLESESAANGRFSLVADSTLYAIGQNPETGSPR